MHSQAPHVHLWAILPARDEEFWSSILGTSTVCLQQTAGLGNNVAQTKVWRCEKDDVYMRGVRWAGLLPPQPTISQLHTHQLFLCSFSSCPAECSPSSNPWVWGAKSSNHLADVCHSLVAINNIVKIFTNLIFFNTLSLSKALLLSIHQSRLLCLCVGLLDSQALVGAYAYTHESGYFSKCMGFII